MRQHANHKTRELAGSPGFQRQVDTCTLCGSRKKVIRHASPRLRQTDQNYPANLENQKLRDKTMLFRAMV